MASKKTQSAGATKPKTGKAPKETGNRESSNQKKQGKAAPKAAETAAPAAVQAAQPTGRVVVEREIGGRKLSIETGRMAKLSDGACVVRYGDTMVLATANSAKAPENIDFFPLTVDYREKTAAAGMIPGGFFKREGRPTTKEILGCRLIDRSIRPMFPDGFRREVQVLSQVLSTDRENDPDFIAAIACYGALAVSSIPAGQALGMCRIGYIGGKLVVNPLWSQVQSPENLLNLTVSGHKDAIVMVEAGAKEVKESVMLEALAMGQKVCAEVASMIEELVAKAGKPKMKYEPQKRDEAIVKAIEERFGADLRSAPCSPGNKQQRSAATKAVKERVAAAFPVPSGYTETQAKGWSMMIGEIATEIAKDGERQAILGGRRADGRDHKTIRQITIEVGVLPRVHGSVLFTRGETQALGIATLGGVDDQQRIDGLMVEQPKRFLLHYSFPPFSVGEVKRVLAPGRREIGHGALAERGLEPVIPAKADFPYTIRITSEILESNGSSSMATVCAGTLAMMDAGVKIKRPVAGVAMGLVMEGKRYAILSDILGSEDACGDMDFKVTGTQDGITALQMDIKCDGLTPQIMKEALEQAREGRMHVLREMLKALRAPREQLSPNAPRLESVKIPTEKIGLIIGPAGRNIRAMQEDYQVKIAVEDGGICTITGVNAEKVLACVEYIKTMTAEVELGTIYEGSVTAIKEFGAFIEVLPGQEGLCHVSELSDQFLRAVTDAVRVGDKLKVKVIGIDDFGKIKLSRKAVILAERGGAPAEAGTEAPRPPREERGPREDRGPRGEFGGRPPREDRGPREERPFRDERAPREDRPFREERAPREDRGPREERGPRGEFGGRPPREDRGPREERPFRDERAPREDRPFREERAPREDRGPREERGPRGEFGGRPPREERAPRAPQGGKPMAEFDTTPEDLIPTPPEAPKGGSPVGELEGVDEFLGGDRGPRRDRGGDRGPRRGRGPRR